MGETAFVGLGANLGDPRGQLEAALAALAAHPGVELLAVSSAYESDPVGPVQRPARLPERRGGGLDDAAGRRPCSRRCTRSRTISAVRARCASARAPATSTSCCTASSSRTTRDLLLPHPRLAERRFVLDPLAELEPMLVLPDGRQVRDLRQAVRDQGVRRLDTPLLGHLS